MITGVDREIFRLALPTLAAIAAQPLFLLADGMMVGRLGVDSLAGFGVASAVLQTLTGVMIFLAFSTTSRVARKLGAGSPAGALQEGVTGLCLAAVLGVVLALLGVLLTPTLVGAFQTTSAVSAEAIAFLTVGMLGVPATLLTYAAAGLLRGLQDAVTPMTVAIVGFGVNIALNFLFIYGLGMGVAGSALGTVLAQWGMAGVYVLVVARRSWKLKVRVTLRWDSARGALTDGWWLFLRTVTLRGALLATMWAAAFMGAAETAGWQVIFTIFSIAAFALDALAVASQALVGAGVGRRDPTYVRQVIRRTCWWGALFGLVTGAAIAAVSGWAGSLITGDDQLSSLVQPGLLVLAAAQPLCGVVFVLDGALMGAGEARYLALAGFLNLVPFVPALVAVASLAPEGAVGILWISLCFFVVYMAARVATLLWRTPRLAVVPATGIDGDEWSGAEARKWVH